MQAVETECPPGLSFEWPNLIAVKHKPIELEAQYVMHNDIVEEDPQNADIVVRESLARQLVKQILEEDLIQIKTDHDIESDLTTFKAKLKLLQE